MSKYLIFDECFQTPSRKTKLFLVYSKLNPLTADDGGSPLGRIEFYPRWRKYVFAPTPATIFDAGCLVDIGTFLRNETVAWHNGLHK